MPGHTSPSSQPTPKSGSTSMEYFRKAGTRSDWEPATRRILRSAVPGKELAETTIRLSGRSRKYASTIEFFQPMKFGRPTRSQPNSEQSELPRGPAHVSGAFTNGRANALVQLDNGDATQYLQGNEPHTPVQCLVPEDNETLWACTSDWFAASAHDPSKRCWPLPCSRRRRARCS